MKTAFYNCLKVLSVLLLCAASAFSASPAEQRDKLMKKLGEDDFKALCSGMKHCLDIDVPGCQAEDQKPLRRLKYDAEFCGVHREVVKRGMSTDMNATMAPEIYARLGRQYRAIYVNEGTLPLNEDVISYLFDNMPFTAELVNAYLESNYSLEYVSKDRRFFNGSNGRTLSGEFYWALQDSAGAKLGLRDMFFGYGHAKILKWSLTGTAVAFLDMDPIPGGRLKYKLTAVVFPGNAVLNSIMQMNVFKKVVNEKLDEIVGDIKKAAGIYFAGNKEPMLKSAALKSQANVQYVIDFENVVKGGHWKLGDFEKLQKERAKAKNTPVPLKVEITK